MFSFYFNFCIHEPRLGVLQRQLLRFKIYICIYIFKIYFMSFSLSFNIQLNMVVFLQSALRRASLVGDGKHVLRSGYTPSIQYIYIYVYRFGKGYHFVMHLVWKSSWWVVLKHDRYKVIDTFIQIMLECLNVLEVDSPASNARLIQKCTQS